MWSNPKPKKLRRRIIKVLKHKESFMMKNFIPQALILAGFYFVVYFLGSHTKQFYLLRLDDIVFICFMILLVFLYLKGNFGWLQRFQAKHRIISDYLQALGAAKYFGLIIFGLCGIAHEYEILTGQFASRGHPTPSMRFAYYMSYVYVIILITGLWRATHKNFIAKYFRLFKSSKTPPHH